MKKYVLFAVMLLIASVTMAQNPGTVKAGNLKLTIRYLKADQSVAAPTYMVDTLQRGDNYSVTSPIVVGFTPNQAVVQGTMPDHDVDVTVIYTKNKHRVSVAQGIEHGTLSLRPSGEVEYDAQVIITIHPAQNYQLDSVWAYNVQSIDELVPIRDNKFNMPDFHVEVNAVFKPAAPVINGNIAEPAAICSGESLALTEPQVANAQTTAWQLAPDGQFASVVTYTNQPLDASYNGWKLRFMASNAIGTVYSNVVSIKVHNFEPALAGDQNLFTAQTGTYTASGVGSSTLTWTVSDAAATFTQSGKTMKVAWATAGTQTVTLTANNEETDCTATVTIDVTVQSLINPADVNDLVAKKKEGHEYLLIYPNPKDTYKYQWYKDGVAINGANGQYYYKKGGLDAGVYKVYLALNADAEGHLFGGAFSSNYTVAGEAKLNLYPNPAQTGENLIIENETGNEVTLTIYAVDGRMVHQQTVNGTNVVIGADLKQGIYTVHLTDGFTQKISKIVIK